MKTLARNNFGTAHHWTLTVALICTPCAFLSAGEPIIFSTGKPKAEPNKLEKYAPEEPITKPWQPPVPQQGSSRPPSTRPVRDPKLERRAKLAREERANWMLVEPGELQAKDDAEAALGIREEDRTYFGKDGKRSLFFEREALKSKTDSSRPATSRPPNAPQRLPADQRDQQAARGEGNSDSNSSEPRVKTNRELSAHTSADLAIDNELINAAKPADQPADSGEPANRFKELFKTDPNAAKAREQKAHREEFQKFLDAPPGATPQQSRANDIASSRPDSVRPHVAPPVGSSSPGDLSPLGSSLSESSGRALSKGFDPFNRPSFGERSSLSGQSDFNRGASPGSSLNSPLFRQPPPSPNFAPKPSFEPPRRSGI